MELYITKMNIVQAGIVVNTNKDPRLFWSLMPGSSMRKTGRMIIFPGIYKPDEVEELMKTYVKRDSDYTLNLTKPYYIGISNQVKTLRNKNDYGTPVPKPLRMYKPVDAVRMEAIFV